MMQNPSPQPDRHGIVRGGHDGLPRMRCAAYVLLGMILAPPACMVLIVVIATPFALIEQMGFHQAWGLLFWIVCFGGYVGAEKCRDRSTQQ